MNVQIAPFREPHVTKPVEPPSSRSKVLAAGDVPFHDIHDLLKAVRRHALMLAVWSAACLAAAGYYLATTPPEYVASTLIILETLRPTANVEVLDSGLVQATLDSAQADSKIQVVKSERNLRLVWDTLKLSETPEYAPTGPGLREKIADMLFPPREAAKSPPSQAAFLNFMNRVGVRRLGQSYVLEISYHAHSASVAAKTVNSITSAYILDQVQSVRRGTEYLQGRISDIKDEENAANEGLRLGKVPSIRIADSDARVISAAIEPTMKAYPQITLTLAFAFAFALVTGLAVVVVRHSFDRKIRTPRHLAFVLEEGFITAMPRLARRERRQFKLYTALSSHRTPAVFKVMRATRTGLSGSGLLQQSSAIGIVSCSRREGRSLIARGLANVLAAGGNDAVLVDADFVHPQLTAALLPLADAGLNDALRNRSTPADVLLHSLSSHLQFVPALATDSWVDPDVFLGSTVMQMLLGTFMRAGTVIVDLPPFDQSSDGLAIGQLLDGVILIVEANRTSLDQATQCLQTLHAARANVLGAVLNKARGL